MKPKKFRKGEHIYTEWGKGVKEVKKVTENIQPKQLQVKLDEEMALGKYANLGSISHTPEEFIIDFIFLPPGADQAKVISRIITSPGHAKRLQLALNDNIQRYESKHGKIMPAMAPEKKIGFT